MTETELILASLTLEELDEANRYARMLGQSWIAQTRDRGTGGARKAGLSTDGPFHAINALRLAVLREMSSRGGGEPWFAGMPLDDHVAAPMLRLYERRFALRPVEPRPNEAGVLERICIACAESKVQDEDHFERIDGLWAERCRDCTRIDVRGIPSEALEAPPVTEPQMELL